MEAAARVPYAPRYNWSMIVRVGAIVAIVALLVGYALKITWDQVVRGGVIQRDGYSEVDLKMMSNFEMDQSRGSREDVPERFRQLDGKKVLMEGEIPPTGMTTGGGASEFEICYSVDRCCFGGLPKVQHFISCRLPPGKRTPPYVAPRNRVQVFGTFHINPIKSPDGVKIMSFFQIDVERVDPA